MHQISDKILKEIKDLLQEYRDYNDYEAGYFLTSCANCITGSCKECAAPYEKTSNRCNEIIDIIEDILYE